MDSCEREYLFDQEKLSRERSTKKRRFDEVSDGIRWMFRDQTTSGAGRNFLGFVSGYSREEYIHFRVLRQFCKAKQIFETVKKLLYFLKNVISFQASFR